MLRWFFGLPVHLRVAIIAAPILSIGGYGLMDLWVRKQNPSTEEVKVQTYELLAQGQCKLRAGDCMIAREGLSIRLKAVPASDEQLLRIQVEPSAYLRGLQMSVVQGEQEDRLIAEQLKDNTEVWYVEYPLERIQQSSFTLRLAAAQIQRVSFAEFEASL